MPGGDGHGLVNRTAGTGPGKTRARNGVREAWGRLGAMRPSYHSLKRRMKRGYMIFAKWAVSIMK